MNLHLSDADSSGVTGNFAVGGSTRLLYGAGTFQAAVMDNIS